MNSLKLGAGECGYDVTFSICIILSQEFNRTDSGTWRDWEEPFGDARSRGQKLSSWLDINLNMLSVMLFCKLSFKNVN